MQTMNTPQEKNSRTKRIFVLAQKLNKLEAFLSVTCMNGMFQNINFCGQIWSEKKFFFGNQSESKCLYLFHNQKIVWNIISVPEIFSEMKGWPDILRPP